MSYDTSNPDDVEGEQTGHRVEETLQVETLGSAVGAFLVLGLGFVFTLFFVGQFTGQNGGIGGGANAIAESGLAFAVILSPLLAVFVGILFGRDDSAGAVRDAGVGSALGFVVMFFVTLVVASSLQTQGALGGGDIIGPMAGYTVGVGLTGATAAAVTRSDAGVTGSLGDYSLSRPIVFGVGSFLAYGVGYGVSVFLADALGPGEAASSSGGLLVSMNVPMLLGIGLLFAPVVGLLVGTLVSRDGVDDEIEGAVGSGVGSALGAALLLVVVYTAILVVEPGGTPAGDFPFGLLVGLLVGTGLTGAGAGYVGTKN
jgi:hypothetical protein